MPKLNRTTTHRDVVSKAPFAEVLRNPLNGQHQLSATKAFHAGEIICSFRAGRLLPQPTYLTVQTGPDTHITLQPECLQYINHSCTPNVFFDTAKKVLVCLKDIEPGAEITFFYPSTEWEMDQPFLCQCGSPHCLQLIQGAAFLSPKVLKQYRLTAFIEEKLLEKAKAQIQR